MSSATTRACRRQNHDTAEELLVECERDGTTSKSTWQPGAAPVVRTVAVSAASWLPPERDSFMDEVMPVETLQSSRRRLRSIFPRASARPGWALAIGLVAAVGSACGSDKQTPARPDGGADAEPPLLVDAGPCGVTTARIAVDSALHVDQGTPLSFSSNPPAGGDHYPFWATWGAHSTAVPRGNWIHNLEHGGIALLYRCAARAACPETAAKLEAIAGALPQDPACSGDVRARVIVTPDPDLPEGVEVAAAAWGATLVARCVDDAAIRAFAIEHYAKAPENTCAQGVELVERDAAAD